MRLFPLGLRTYNASFLTHRTPLWPTQSGNGGKLYGLQFIQHTGPKHQLYVSQCISWNCQFEFFFFNSRVTALKLPAVGGDRVGCGSQKNHKIKQEIKSWKLCKTREATEQRNCKSPSPRLVTWLVNPFTALLMFRCSLPPPKSRTFPGSVNARAIRPGAIFSSSSSLVLRSSPDRKPPSLEGFS